MDQQKKPCLLQQVEYAMNDTWSRVSTIDQVDDELTAPFWEQYDQLLSVTGRPTN